MRLKVNLSSLASGLSIDETVDLYCGRGDQILQWVGHAACSRLAYKRGDVYGRYVPQSVSTKDGVPLDVDIVVNEIFSDGDEIFVEYSGGPMPYRVRWEGRPRTPPFKWSEQGEVQPPHDAWLKDLDLRQEGMAMLVDADSVKGPAAGVDQDLAETKKILVQYSGSIQMVFYYQSSEGASSGDQLGQITLPQFRGLMQSSKAITPRFPAEKVDEIFTSVVTSEQALMRRVDNKSGVSTFDLLDFNIALLHVAYQRAAVTSYQPNMMSLSSKLQELLKDSFLLHTFPDLTKKLEKFSPAVGNPAAQLLLKRGRRLIEQTLDTCQLKRVKAAAVRVDLRWLCNHFTRWALLNRDFNLQELAIIAVFAKQPSSGAGLERFKLHPQPLEYDYAEFERLLLGMAWHVYQVKKKGDVVFEEFLGEMLDSVFKKSGVLAELPKDEEDGEGYDDQP